MMRMLLISLTTVAVAASLASAQVSQKAGGNALDVNTRVGSGGSNAGSGRGTQALDADLYINGQSSGLSSFHGNIGYTPPNQWQGKPLPSSSQSDFNRQSVTLQDVMNNRALAPAPYFDPSKTILNAGGILAGQNLPGTNVPRSTSADGSLGKQLYIDATVQYKSLLPNPAGRVLSDPLQTPPVSYSVAGSVASTPLPISGVPEPSASLARPGTGTLLGLMRAQDREVLARELSQLSPGRIDTGIQGGIDARAVDANGDPNRGGGPGLNKIDTQLNPPSPAEPLPAGPQGRAGAKKNQDIYMDLLQRLRDRRDQEDLARQSRNNAAMLSDSNLIAQTTGPVGGLVELTGDKDIIVHSLVGASPDQINQHMADADQKLKDGRYYEAAEVYEMVAAYDSRNPLPEVGCGLAYFVAGEPLTAGMHFHNAISLFPPLMEARLDIPKMMDLAAYRAQLEILDRRLTTDRYEKIHPMLLLAGTFLHANIGQMDDARKYARKLREIAADDKLTSAYADYVLTGKRPDAETRPATQPSATTQTGASTRPAASTQPSPASGPSYFGQAKATTRPQGTTLPSAASLFAATTRPASAPASAPGAGK